MEEPMVLEESKSLVAEIEAEIEIEGDGEEDDMMISSIKMEGTDEAPHDIENPKDPLLEELDNLSSLSPFRCIFRVPRRLRNEEACTPQVVSIGPLHHGKAHLKAMEMHKKRYLRDFLSRTPGSFSDYIQMIKGQEERLRGSYAEPIEFGSDQFVKIVLVDAAFVIEFLLRHHSSLFVVDDDYIFNEPRMKSDVFPDLRLLENQLPFFILEDIFNTVPSAHQLPSLLEISYNLFQTVIDGKGKKGNLEKTLDEGSKVKHFVDLMRILYQPLELKVCGRSKFKAPNITELVQAGVKIQVRTGSSFLDIKFSRGMLEIPKLSIFSTTELTYRNLVAFEQCQRKKPNYLSSYVSLMKLLVRTQKDAELLVEYKILYSAIGDTQRISRLFRDLGAGVMLTGGVGSYYATLTDDLNDYCRIPRHKWMANLRQNYFSTPWSIISVVAAVILLILTLIQTVCSLISIA